MASRVAVSGTKVSPGWIGENSSISCSAPSAVCPFGVEPTANANWFPGLDPGCNQD